MTPDRSNGYGIVAAELLAGRGGPLSARIGARTVRERDRRLTPGARVLDLGRGSGVPITEVLVETDFSVCAVDASPTLVAAFGSRFPRLPIACEPAEESNFFFGRRFDAVLAWGLMFLLAPSAQRALIRRIAGTLNTGGRLLSTSPAGAVTGNEAISGGASRSVGTVEYRRRLSPPPDRRSWERTTTRVGTTATMPPSDPPHRRCPIPRTAYDRSIG